MNATFAKPVWSAVVGITLLGWSGPVAAQDTPVPAVPAEELPAGSQVLTGGPVHEAFAKPVTTDPEPPILVPQAPPEPLSEIPPAEKPAGATIVWVPGYWAWDEDRHDYIWVSGCWRNAPPTTYWVPGHWLQVGNGWQWIGGFWQTMAAQPQQQIEYLPTPPAAFDIAPPSSPPLPDQLWVPGCWYWWGGQYVRRPGYWMVPQVGWVWVPSHYVWTPRGYIFSPGHWDYDLDNRGVLFTPAYFPPAVRARVGFVFCPGVCVDLGMLRLNLFAYPRYRHYYFGDYYDDTYLRMGIYPWFKCQTVHTWYDPLFVYDSWHMKRVDPNWTRHQAQEYKLRHADRDLRPARTYTEFRVQMDHLPPAKRAERPLVQPVKTFAVSQATSVKFERITTTERQQFAVKSTEVRNFREQRTHWEAPAAKTVPMPSLPSRQPVEPRIKPAPMTPPRAPVIQPAVRAKQEKSAPPPVRVTRPEQVVVPSPAITAKPTEPRYIEKQAPVRPAQERYRTDAPSKSPAKDLRTRPQSSVSPERDQKR